MWARLAHVLPCAARSLSGKVPGMPPARHYDRLCQLVKQIDPLLVEAVDDIDRGLLEWALQLSPWERLSASSEALAFLSNFHRAAPETS